MPCCVQYIWGLNLRNCPRTLHEFTIASSARVCDFVCAYRHEFCAGTTEPTLGPVRFGFGFGVGFGLGWVGYRWFCGPCWMLRWSWLILTHDINKKIGVKYFELLDLILRFDPNTFLTSYLNYFFLSFRLNLKFEFFF